MEGLKQKYILEKTNGKPVNPEADYFVLRLDSQGDEEHVEASRKAIKVYADNIEDFNPQLAQDLREKYL